MRDSYRVGKIVNTHGVRGELRIISTTDFADERYAVGAKLFIAHPSLKEKIEVIVKSHRTHKNFDLLTFEGFDTIDAVEKYKGGELFVAAEDLQALPENEFYYHEIIGCHVVTDEGEELGKVKEILSPGANDVWVVQRKKGGKDLLLPYIDDVVKEIVINEKRIVVHLLEGLE